MSEVSLVEETVKQLSSHKGVVGVLVVTGGNNTPLHPSPPHPVRSLHNV